MYPYAAIKENVHFNDTIHDSYISLTEKKGEITALAIIRSKKDTL